MDQRKKAFIVVDGSLIMHELKPCPFCGEKRESFIYPYTDSTLYWIKCDQCDTEGPVARNEEDAINKWNTRKDQKCITKQKN
jgi:Lar family restriction alleviation protein